MSSYEDLSTRLGVLFVWQIKHLFIQELLQIFQVHRLPKHALENLNKQLRCCLGQVVLLVEEFHELLLHVVDVDHARVGLEHEIDILQIGLQLLLTIELLQHGLDRVTLDAVLVFDGFDMSRKVQIGVLCFID